VRLGELDALGAIVLLGQTKRFSKLCPGSRGATLFLVTERDVEQRTATRIEPLALLELAAALGNVSLVDQVAPLFEELRGERLVSGRLANLKLS
jgi:hypothetical protein